MVAIWICGNGKHRAAGCWVGWIANISGHLISRARTRPTTMRAIRLAIGISPAAACTATTSNSSARTRTPTNRPPSFVFQKTGRRRSQRRQIRPRPEQQRRRERALVYVPGRERTLYARGRCQDSGRHGPAGLIINGDNDGERADVIGRAKWRDGHWTLVTARDLQISSKYGKNFVPGQPLYMWVAVFDHTQTRHTVHSRPVRVVVQE